MTDHEDNAMNLQIRDKRAHELARRLAERDKTTMTEAVISALENELERKAEEPSFQERVAVIVDKLHRLSPGGGRQMTKDEIDEMWGHE